MKRDMRDTRTRKRKAQLERLATGAPTPEDLVALVRAVDWAARSLQTWAQGPEYPVRSRGRDGRVRPGGHGPW